MPPRPQLTTGPLPKTTTIYKTVQCLFIGTMGYKYHTEREKETLYAHTVCYMSNALSHTHTKTGHRTQTSAAAPAWWWLWCSLQRQSGEVGCCLERVGEQGGNLLPLCLGYLFLLLFFFFCPQPLHLRFTSLLLSCRDSGGGEETFGQVILVELGGGHCGGGREEEKEEEGERYRVGLPRYIISSLRGLFALVRTTRTGCQNPLHKVFGPPGN